MKGVAALLVVFLGSGGSLAAQRGTWVSLGLGVAPGSGPTDPVGDIAVHLAASYQFGANVVTLRSASSADDLFSLIFAVDDSVTSLTDVGLLYGRAMAPGRFHVSVAAGVGRITFTRARDDSTFFDSSRFTVPMEVQVAWRPTQVFGLVLVGFASLNSEESLYGATVGVQLGRLR